MSVLYVEDKYDDTGILRDSDHQMQVVQGLRFPNTNLSQEWS